MSDIVLVAEKINNPVAFIKGLREATGLLERMKETSKYFDELDEEMFEDD